MVTLLAWDFYCEVIGSALYDLMLSLVDDEPAYLAMNVGFDVEHRRLFPDFYLD